MRFLSLLCFGLLSGAAFGDALAPVPVSASATPSLPPGLSEAQLLPGWETADGHRVAALKLVLEPGWKTYWRSPGDAGVPPVFDWSGSEILAR